MSQFTLKNLRKLFKNVPRVIDASLLESITDTSFLLELETQYDKFLETNLQLLQLYNFIDELLNVRDFILIKLNRAKREAQIRKHNEEFQYSNSNKKTSKVQIEYICGCQQIIFCKKQCHHYCNAHLDLLMKKNILVDELSLIDSELKNISLQQNIKHIEL